MCGRFNVIDDPITQSIMELLGIDFSITTNDNVCPSELISSIAITDNKLIQINASWGIKPDWANRLIINAQSETVNSKKTFKNAFLSHRCIVPISGWYEWKAAKSGKKEKFLFSNEDNAMFMAGIIVKNDQQDSPNDMVDLFGELIQPKVLPDQIVSLTAKANSQCAHIHSRMPLLIHSSELREWLSGDPLAVIDSSKTRNEALITTTVES